MIKCVKIPHRTLDFRGAVSGNVAQNVVEPPLEVEMGTYILEIWDFHAPSTWLHTRLKPDLQYNDLKVAIN